MAKILMYATASCPFCLRAEALLAQRGFADVEKIRVDLQPEEREVMMQRTGRHTVPQIFIGDRHIGGCDDLMALDASGGLLPLLEADN
jgi:glutaredoxin 3